MRNWRSRLPEGSLNRTRLAAVVLAGIAQFAQLGQVGNPLRSAGYLRLSALCIVLIFVVMVAAYRGRAGWWSAIVVPVLCIVGGSGLIDPIASTALVMPSALVLSLQGSTRLWLARVFGALISMPCAVAISPLSGGREMNWNSPTVLGVVPQILLLAVLTRGIYLALVRQERAAAREAVVARAGHAMLGVTDADRIREVGRLAAEDLVTLNPGVALLVLRRRAGTLEVTDLAGAPDRLRGQQVDAEVAHHPARLAGLLPEFRDWQVDALGADMFIAVGGQRRVPPDVLDGFRTLSHQVVLAEGGCFAHAELEHRAHHDHLTHLPTRTKFLRAVEGAIADPAGGVVALLNVDLDDFKQVNDGYGHAAGDELLVQIAARMTAVAQGRGMAARFGGDEFALLLTGLADTREADRIAELLCNHLAAPVMLSAATVTVGASIGIAVAEPGLTVTDLARRADIAMYEAKTAGKNRVEAYRPPTGSRRVGRHRLVEEPHQAA